MSWADEYPTKPFRQTTTVRRFYRVQYQDNYSILYAMGTEDTKDSDLTVLKDMPTIRRR